MSPVLLDVTDLVEFLQREESVSGVQRVIAEVSPSLIEQVACVPVILDRRRGCFVALTQEEVGVLIAHGARSDSPNPSRPQLAQAATKAVERAATADPVRVDLTTTMVFLGAVWSSDALMLAIRNAHAQGARCVYLLYDLTPVMEAGHTAGINNLFERYLSLLWDTGVRVPAISQSSRRDFEETSRLRGRPVVAGTATGLPQGFAPDQFDLSDNPWPRPYVLTVGTIEARKNHLLAFQVWRELIDRLGAENVPDLVCIGRLGWHSDAFLKEMHRTRGLGGKVSVLSHGVSDAELARFYAHSMFTIYPSRYEGWGLPVSESLAFAKVVLTHANSSIPEAGGQAATYVSDESIEAWVTEIEPLLNPEVLHRREEQLKSARPPTITWEQVARTLVDEVRVAQRTEGAQGMGVDIELGREYMLSLMPAAPDAAYADQYAEYLRTEATTPLLSQPRGERDFEVTDSLITGELGSPQTWGLELRPGRSIRLRFTRPIDGNLIALLSTRSMPGKVSVESVGPGGTVHHELYLGSVLEIPLGEGRQGETAQATITVTDAHDSIEGFLGICSVAILDAHDTAAQLVALRSASAALRQELDFITGTRSWRVTAPLRKWKGRGA